MAVGDRRRRNTDIKVFPPSGPHLKCELDQDRMDNKRKLTLLQQPLCNSVRTPLTARPRPIYPPQNPEQRQHKLDIKRNTAHPLTSIKVCNSSHTEVARRSAKLDWGVIVDIMCSSEREARLGIAYRWAT